MVYKAPDLGYHTTFKYLPYPQLQKKKELFSKKKQKNNWTKTYTCTIASIWESLYDK